MMHQQPSQQRMTLSSEGADFDDHSSYCSGVEYSEAASLSQGGENKGVNRKDDHEAVQLLSITKNENQAVFCLRVLLIGCLLVSAVLVSIFVYMYTSSEESDAFQSQFESDALKLLEAIGTTLDLTLGAADSFMIRVVSQAQSTNAVWPMVTIPNLAVQAAKLIAQTDSIYFTFYPCITGEQRSEWENFTKHNDGWVAESLEVQERNPNFRGPILDDYPISHSIWRNEGPEAEDSDGPFMPSWLGSPVIPTYAPYNWNGLAYDAFAKGLVFSMETKSVVMTSVANHADPNDPVAVGQAATTSNWAIPYIDEDENPNEPFADMYYPVIDKIEDVVLNPSKDTKALGVVAFSFFWRHILRNILPPNSKGLVLVFENPCGNQYFTYQIDGKTPTFLGFGDKHEAKETYEELAMSRNLTDLINLDGMYTGLSMSDEFCPYTITVYPSATMEGMHITTDPVIFTVVAASIFFFTSLIFLSYDYFANRRQRLIKNRAVASANIVSSLFPEQVRGQLYEDNEARDNQTHLGRKSQFEQGSKANALTNSVIVGRPNAQLYLNTTVFMADLVGFTAWSSKRTPVEVFELLEGLYGEFDQLAARRRVFKVETIGDCYVAVTGIPKAQATHALNMVRFARDTLERMPVVCRLLADRLGEDTKDLGIRVGLHSGSTTAGVLRGAKGRFQLFGDTINTAARMESNGVKNRIQVSQATADELIKHGKENWLVPREGKVAAKGKGDMQTYFINTKQQRGTSSSTTSGDELGMSISDRLAASSSNYADFGMSLADRLMNSSGDHTAVTTAMSISDKVTFSSTDSYDDEYDAVVEV